jgi:putative restriction endonuclease
MAVKPTRPTWQPVVTERLIEDMSALTVATNKVTGEHRMALEWFNAHRGQRVTWNAIQEYATNSARLVAQAKGIYKPHYTDYALSVRTLEEGPYPDKEVEFRPDGSWVVQYFQENRDPKQRDREATNRGLMRCLSDGIPIGFLIKRKPKPGVEYEVLGLGLVTGWEEGYFTIEGFALDGSTHTDSGETDAAHARARSASLTDLEVAPFESLSDSDLREKTLAMVARRRGQASFRAMLLDAYSGKCCISGCDFVEVLEAAHIAPYRGVHSHHPQNGLLLRADLHTLFDLGHISVSDEYRVMITSKARASFQYQVLEGKKLTLPSNPSMAPSRLALSAHRTWCGL